MNDVTTFILQDLIGRQTEIPLLKNPHYLHDQYRGKPFILFRQIPLEDDCQVFFSELFCEQ